MTSQYSDINKAIQDAEKEKQKKVVDLKSHSKKLYELVVTEKFTVHDVVAESYATSFTPHSEMRFGGSSPVYRGGFTSRLVLKVSPDNQDVPITTLNFEGFSIVKAGDYISAQIPKFVERRVETGFHSRPYNRDKVLYFDRDFNPEESAVELALLSTDGKILRRDRSVNYKNFEKK
jgi:hypothetical protein